MLTGRASQGTRLVASLSGSARKLQSVKIKRGKRAPTQICCGSMAFEEEVSSCGPVGAQSRRVTGQVWGWGSAVRQVVRWELWGEVSSVVTPRAPRTPSFLPLRRNSAGSASWHVVHSLTGCSWPGRSGSSRTAAVMRCQI